MSSSRSSPEPFRRLYVERGLEDSPYLAGALPRLGGLAARWIRSRREIPPEDLNPATLLLCRPRGRTVTRCPGSRGHLCCNYFTVDLYLGCTLGCSYCILRGYLNFAPMTVYLDPEPAIRRLRRLAEGNPDRIVRAGTGEVGDSLLLDPVFRLSEPLIRALAPYPNVALELKTKTGSVGHLLGIEPKGNTVIGFSLNPPSIIRAYEAKASPLEERLAAARRAVEAGFRVAFHFDPIIAFPNAEAEYRQVAAALGGFPSERVAWISMGTFRSPPRFRDRLGAPELLYEELVPCRDGKLRYLQKVRSLLYRNLEAALRRHLAAPVYLCMESPAVWRAVFGLLPRAMPSMRDIFQRIHGGGL